MQQSTSQQTTQQLQTHLSQNQQAPTRYAGQASYTQSETGHGQQVVGVTSTALYQPASTSNNHGDGQYLQTRTLVGGQQAHNNLYQPSNVTAAGAPSGTVSVTSYPPYQQHLPQQHSSSTHHQLSQYGSTQDPLSVATHGGNLLHHQAAAAAPNSGQASSSLQQQHLSQYQQQNFAAQTQPSQQQQYPNSQSQNIDPLLLSALTNQLQNVGNTNSNIGIDAQSALSQIQALLLAQQPQQQQLAQLPVKAPLDSQQNQQQQVWQSQPPHHVNQQQQYQIYGQPNQYLNQASHPSAAPVQNQQPAQAQQNNPLALVGMLNELQKNLTAIIQSKQGGVSGVPGPRDNQLQYQSSSIPFRSHFMKYFVGGILYSARETDVERYMREFGKVVDVAIMRDKHSGRSRGFAFVTFEVNGNDPQLCERLNRIMLEENRHSIGGRNVEIREGDGNKPADSFLAKSSEREEGNTSGQRQQSTNQGQRSGNRSSKRSRSRSRNRGERGGSRQRRNDGKPAQQQGGNTAPQRGGGARDKVFVGGLDYQLSEEEFSRFFSEFGLVKEVQIVKDPNNNASRGFGFVTFEDESVAQHLIQNVQKADMYGRSVDLRSAEPKVSSNDKSSTNKSGQQNSSGLQHAGSQKEGKKSQQFDCDNENNRNQSSFAQGRSDGFDGGRNNRNSHKNMRNNAAGNSSHHRQSDQNSFGSSNQLRRDESSNRHENFNRNQNQGNSSNLNFNPNQQDYSHVKDNQFSSQFGVISNSEHSTGPFSQFVGDNYGSSSKNGLLGNEQLQQQFAAQRSRIKNPESSNFDSLQQMNESDLASNSRLSSLKAAQVNPSGSGAGYSHHASTTINSSSQQFSSPLIQSAFVRTSMPIAQQQSHQTQQQKQANGGSS